MGRLTLNMLLSFAQFEREVTAERIRDKIAASKAKGMWMGGNPPLGYRPEGRSLEIVPEHAELIRQLFTRYLAIGNVRLLAEQLEAEGTQSARAHLLDRQDRWAAAHFSRGQIYKILSNPIYLGEIHHRGKVYEGKHEAIIDARPVGAGSGPACRQHAREHGAPPPSSHPACSPVWCSTSMASRSSPRMRASLSRARSREERSATATMSAAASSMMHVPMHRRGIRIPAREIEAAVAGCIADALADPFDIMAKAGIVAESDSLGSTLQRIETLADRVRKKDHRILRGLVARVTAHPREIAIELSVEGLCRASRNRACIGGARNHRSHFQCPT